MKLFPRKKKEPHAEAKAALEESKANLEDTLAIRREVEGITDRLRQMRLENHFSEKIRSLIIGEEG